MEGYHVRCTSRPGVLHMLIADQGCYRLGVNEICLSIVHTSGIFYRHVHR